MSLIAYKEGFSLFHLFGVVSGMFQPIPACYDLFQVIPRFTSNNVTECFLTCKFTTNQLLQKSVSVIIKLF